MTKPIFRNLDLNNTRDLDRANNLTSKLFVSIFLTVNLTQKYLEKWTATLLAKSPCISFVWAYSMSLFKIVDYTLLAPPPLQQPSETVIAKVS